MKFNALANACYIFAWGNIFFCGEPFCYVSFATIAACCCKRGKAKDDATEQKPDIYLMLKGLTHGLINYIDNKAKFRHILKN